MALKPWMLGLLGEDSIAPNLGLLSVATGTDPIKAALASMATRQMQPRITESRMPAAPGPRLPQSPVQAPKPPSRPDDVGPGISPLQAGGLAAGAAALQTPALSGTGAAIGRAIDAGLPAYIATKQQRDAARANLAETQSFRSYVMDPENGLPPTVQKALLAMGVTGGRKALDQYFKEDQEQKNRLALEAEKGKQARLTARDKPAELSPDGKDIAAGLKLPPNPDEWDQAQTDAFRKEEGRRFQIQNLDHIDRLTDQARNIAASLGLPRDDKEWTPEQRAQFRDAFNKNQELVHHDAGGGGVSWQLAFSPDGPVAFNPKTLETKPIDVTRQDPDALIKKMDSTLLERRHEAETGLKYLQEAPVPPKGLLAYMEKYPNASLATAPKEYQRWLSSVRTMAVIAGAKSGRTSQALINSEILEFIRGVAGWGAVDGSSLSGAMKDTEEGLQRIKNRPGGGGGGSTDWMTQKPGETNEQWAARMAKGPPKP